MTGVITNSNYLEIFFFLQIVIMKRDDGDGWLLGKAGDSEGLFPENYAERLHEV